MHPELHGRDSPHVNVAKEKQFEEVSAAASETPYSLTSATLLPLTNMMENIFIFKRSSPLKASVKLTLSIRGKPAIPICQSSHLLEGSAHRLSPQLNASRQEQPSVFEGTDEKTRGKCFFAAAEESTRSTTKMTLFQENLCGFDVSKT